MLALVLLTSHYLFFNQKSGKPLTASMNESANASLAELLQEAANQANHTYGNLSLVIFNATLAALLVHSGAVNFDAVAPVVGEFFAEGVFTVPQQCIYPISGP